MALRGRIIRDTSSGVGLISANGNQYEFKLEGVWKSDFSPKQDMVVDIELDSNQNITLVTAVSETDLAKEQAEKAAKMLQEKGLAAFNDIAARVGKNVLIATALVGFSWFFLNVLTIQISSSLKNGITFWELLGIINSSGGINALQSPSDMDKGLWGFIGFVAIIGPFIHQFWKKPVAHLGNCLPLALMICAGIAIYMGVQDSIAAANNTSGDLFGGGTMGKQIAEYTSQIASQMIDQILKAVKVGVGGYIAIVASIYLAFIGLTKFLASKA